jgi:hypothetical protein
MRGMQHVKGRAAVILLIGKPPEAVVPLELA